MLDHQAVSLAVLPRETCGLGGGLGCSRTRLLESLLRQRHTRSRRRELGIRLGKRPLALVAILLCHGEALLHGGAGGHVLLDPGQGDGPGISRETKGVPQGGPPRCAGSGLHLGALGRDLDLLSLRLTGSQVGLRLERTLLRESQRLPQAIELDAGGGQSLLTPTGGGGMLYGTAQRTGLICDNQVDKGPHARQFLQASDLGVLGDDGILRQGTHPLGFLEGQRQVLDLAIGGCHCRLCAPEIRSGDDEQLAGLDQDLVPGCECLDRRPLQQSDDGLVACLQGIEGLGPQGNRRSVNSGGLLEPGLKSGELSQE